MSSLPTHSCHCNLSGVALHTAAPLSYRTRLSLLLSLTHSTLCWVNWRDQSLSSSGAYLGAQASRAGGRLVAPDDRAQDAVSGREAGRHGGLVEPRCAVCRATLLRLQRWCRYSRVYVEQVIFLLRIQSWCHVWFLLAGLLLCSALLTGVCQEAQRGRDVCVCGGCFFQIFLVCQIVDHSFKGTL